MFPRPTPQAGSVHEGRGNLHYFFRGVSVASKQAATFPLRLAARATSGIGRVASRVLRAVPRTPADLKDPVVFRRVAVTCFFAGAFAEAIVNGRAGQTLANGQSVPWHWSAPAVIALGVATAPFAGAGCYQVAKAARAVGRHFVEAGRAEEQRRLG